MENTFDEEIDPEMAAAMGFSSFGGQKRKYRPDAPDAFTSLDGSTSGANNTEMGIRKKRPDETSIPDRSMGGNQSAGSLQAAASAGLSHFITQAQALPPRPPQAESAPAPRSFPTGVPKQFFDQLGWKELEAYRKGVKDDNGDIAYFLPSFVEDPWAKLEKLQSNQAQQ